MCAEQQGPFYEDALGGESIKENGSSVLHKSLPPVLEMGVYHLVQVLMCGKKAETKNIYGRYLISRKIQKGKDRRRINNYEFQNCSFTAEIRGT